MSKLTFVLLAGLVAAVLLVSGCGSDDGESTSTAAAPLTKAQFLKQGEEICRKGEEERDEAIDAFLDKQQEDPQEGLTLPEQIRLITKIALPPLQQQAEELDELGVPEGDEKQVEAIITGMEKAVEEVEANPTTVLKPSTDPFASAGQQARQYGLKICAQF